MRTCLLLATPLTCTFILSYSLSSIFDKSVVCKSDYVSVYGSIYQDTVMLQWRKLVQMLIDLRPDHESVLCSTQKRFEVVQIFKIRGPRIIKYCIDLAIYQWVNTVEWQSMDQIYWLLFQLVGSIYNRYHKTSSITVIFFILFLILYYVCGRIIWWFLICDPYLSARLTRNGRSL